MAHDRDLCIIHAADLHLGSRRWLRSVPRCRTLAERVAHADTLALRALTQLCVEERASLLLLAGDLVDGWCRDHRVGLELAHELDSLRRLGCQAALLLGNHDARTRVVHPLLLPESARVIGIGGPETRVLDRLGVALHGWSLPELERGGDVAALYPPPVSGMLNVGLLHTSAEGASGHPDYAPCSRRTLRGHGYDYWALGHVHAHQILSREPWVVFPGNLQGRGAREHGPKGAVVVSVRAGAVTRVEHRPLEAVRFETVMVDADAALHLDDVLAEVRARASAMQPADRETPVVARIVVGGPTAVGRLLELPMAQRARAFDALRVEASSPTLWIDEVWLDAGEAGAWRVEAA